MECDEDQIDDNDDDEQDDDVAADNLKISMMMM
jgi:hypothetical protein